MAIKINLQNSNVGIAFSGAYFRIVTAAASRMSGYDFTHGVIIDVIGYATEPIDPNIQSVDFRRYLVSISEIDQQQGNEFFGKCYQWVMQQPDMAGCIAV